LGLLKLNTMCFHIPIRKTFFHYNHFS
jgi:hypothetical protein